MKAQMQYAELRTYTPALGEFIITGTMDDVQAAGRSFEGCKPVTESRFDKLVYGHATRRKLAFF